MLRFFSRLLLALGLVSLLVGCTNSGRSYVDERIQETLEVDILPNTSKMFTYRLRLPAPDPLQMAASRRTNEARPGVPLGRDTPARLLANVDYVVRESGYCREGFLELDRSISSFHLWVRGECREGANESDREQFSSAKILTADDWKERR